MQLHSETAHSACYAGTSGGACSWGGGRGALSGHPPSAEEPSTFTSSSPCCSAGASCSRYSCTAGGRARRVSGAWQGVPNTTHGRACSSSRQRVATQSAGRRPELRQRRSSWSAAGPNPGPETGASIRRDRQRRHLNVLPKGGSLRLVLGRELVRQEGRRIHVQAAPAAAGVRAARLRSACGTLVQAGAVVGQHASCCGRPVGRLPALLPHFRGTCPFLQATSTQAVGGQQAQRWVARKPLLPAALAAGAGRTCPGVLLAADGALRRWQQLRPAQQLLHPVVPGFRVGGIRQGCRPAEQTGRQALRRRAREKARCVYTSPHNMSAHRGSHPDSRAAPHAPEQPSGGARHAMNAASGAAGLA